DDVQQQPPGGAQALVHVVAAVQVRVVDQALPPGDGARLLEVDPHHDEQVLAQGTADLGQLPGVVEGRCRVVHRTGAHDHQQPVIGQGEHAPDLGPALLDGGFTGC